MNLPVITFGEYIELNERRPMGILGPIGPPVAVRIAIQARPVPARRVPPRRPWESAADRRRRERLEEHAAEAHEARTRERLERHRRDAEHAAVVARLRRLR